jgi:translation elongation factor EF-G
MNTIAIEEKVDDLLACLDKDVQRVQESLSQLTELRSLVIKRDDAALGKLLENIQAGSDRYRTQESQRQSIRMDLAAALGCKIERITLSSLEKNLSKTKREQVSRMQTRLKSLVQQLRKEYLSTVLLLSECSRLNNMLLKSIFNVGGTGDVYYNANGVSRRQTGLTFVNLQL